MIDVASVGLGFASLVAVPVGYFVKKVNDTATRLAAHEASTLATFKAIDTSLTDLKVGQKDTGEKVDRLVERLL